MFEFIGVCVVAFVVWRIAKKLIFGGLNKTLSRAVTFAIKHDVPHSFAVNIIKKPSVMREARVILKNNKPEFSTLDVYEQYGLAIVMLYQGARAESGGDYYEGDDGSKAFADTKALAVELGVPSDSFQSLFVNNIDELKELAYEIDKPGELHHNTSFETRMAVAVSVFYNASQKKRKGENNETTTEKVVMFLRPQIDSLEGRGLRTHVNDVTFAYVLVVATHMTKKPMDFSDLKKMVREIFYKYEHIALIENAYEIVNSAPEEFLDKCRELTPLVSKEIEKGKGEFYEKYTEKALREIDEMFSCGLDYDPRKEKKTSFMDV